MQHAAAGGVALSNISAGSPACCLNGQWKTLALIEAPSTKTKADGKALMHLPTKIVDL